VSPPEDIREKIIDKVASLEARFEQLERDIAEGIKGGDHDRYAKIGREHATLARQIEPLRQLRDVRRQIGEAEALLASDRDMADLATEELNKLREQEASLADKIVTDFLSEEDDGSRNVIVEIRAGTGGDEATLFARDLYRMYSRYAEEKRWRVDVASQSPSEVGGFKEVVFSVTGKDVWRYMRFESGIHRVQRVPKTESQGRIHTSAATVAVLPEADAIEMKIDPAEIRMDFMRASGPGGQKVNKTSSAVRLTHLPTGVSVHIQDEKSQHKNRSRAMRILRARLYEMECAKTEGERAAMRRGQVGTGDRSEKIRTYNFPDNRVTDHRIGVTIHDLPGFLDGRLDPLVQELIRHSADERVRELLDKE